MIPLERGQLWVMRIHALAVGALALAAGLLGEAILRDNVDLPPGIVTIPLLVLLLYPVLVAPGRRYRAWGYAMDADELRIARGVWTRIETIVPLARVQHVDVSQGPIERTFGVCRLVLHTAGTAHSQVVLPGLTRETAEAMRSEIRAHIRQELE